MSADSVNWLVQYKLYVPGVTFSAVQISSGIYAGTLVIDTAAVRLLRSLRKLYIRRTSTPLIHALSRSWLDNETGQGGTTTAIRKWRVLSKCAFQTHASDVAIHLSCAAVPRTLYLGDLDANRMTPPLTYTTPVLHLFVVRAFRAGICFCKGVLAS